MKQFGKIKAAADRAPTAAHLTMLLRAYADFALKQAETDRLSLLEDP